MITLRNKTIEKLSELQQQILTDTLEGLAQRKCKDEVEEYIWRLTYQPTETALDMMGFPEGIILEEIIIIRNEIASHFRGIQKDWSYGKEEVFGKKYAENEAYKALRKALDDPYALHEVVRHCEAYIYLDTTAISKTIGCLRSTWPTSHEKGFNRLQFSKDEQKYLEKAKKEIAAFLESLCIDRLEVYREENKRNEETKNIQSPCSERVNATAISTDTVESEQCKAGMTPDQILSRKEEIKAFFKAYDGIDMPEWLIANRKKVEKLLEAYDQF